MTEKNHFNFEKPSMGPQIDQDLDEHYSYLEQVKKEARPEVYRELEELLETVDFETLRKQFEKLATRCGIPTESFNFIGSDRVGILTFADFFGAYDPTANRIFINPRKIKEAGDHNANPEDVEKYMPIRFLRVLIHEEVHAISYRQVVGDSMNPDIVSGYKSVSRVDERIEGLRYALDEGVTEKLARELLPEYLRSQGISVPEDLAKYDPSKPYTSEAYNSDINLVNTLIKTIAGKSNMSEETVWNAIVRSKLEGVDLQNSELAQFLDEHTYRGLSEKLKHLKHSGYKEEFHKIHSCIQKLEDNS